MFEHKRVRVAALVLALGAGSAGVTAAQEGASSLGRFSAPFAEDPTFNDRPPQTYEEAKRTPPAVHMAMLPDGRVAYFGGNEGNEDLKGPLPTDGGRVLKPASSRLLDMRKGTTLFTKPGNNTGGPTLIEDLFCADQRVLMDGRLLAVGGSVWATDPVDISPVTGDEGPAGTMEAYGSDATRWLDFRHKTPKWVGEERHRMQKRRWYPTAVTLADGRVLVASGVDRLIWNLPGQDRADIRNVKQMEVFDPRTNGWEMEPASADISLPLYPRLHLAHDGNVVYVGAGDMWAPVGWAADEALWNLQQVYDPDTKEWVVSGVGAFGARGDAFTMPLMMKAPYDTTRILVGAGTIGTSPSSYLGTALSEIITYEHGKTRSTRTGDLNQPRWFTSGVLLPSGQVVALAGGDKNANVVFGTDASIRRAELFDPETRTWSPLAAATRERTYHSTAILLPDGRILLGGHAPQPLGGEQHPPGAAPNLKDPSFEIYTPPYLDPARGRRPRITAAKAGMAYARPRAKPYAMRVSGKPSKVVLMHLPATTHVMDADQRGVELEFRRGRKGRLSVTPPPHGAVAPPGFYYLFVLNERGVPSKARIVQVGRRAVRGQARAPYGK